MGRSPIILILGFVIVLGIGFVAGALLNPFGQEPTEQSVGAPQIMTVPVLITATTDPEATERVLVVTATPLPGSIGALPTGILDETPTRQAATLDPEMLGADAALQETATALPENCILHSIEEGDTPFGIAEIYGAEFFNVMEVNGLDDEAASRLQIGQVLIVPLEGCPLTRADVVEAETTATPADAEATEEVTAEATAEVSEEPTVRPTLTLPPTAVNAQIEIVQVMNPGDVTAEGVEIRNTGGVVDLDGWTLQDSEGNTFTFPQQRLFTNGSVTVYTRVGTNTPILLFWGRSQPVWGEPGEIVTLSNVNGEVQSVLRLEAPVDLP